MIGIAFFVAFVFVREYVRNGDIAAELARMEAENASLQQQHLASLQLISELSTETAVEGDARTKLNLAKPGESLYVVQNTSPAEDAVSPSNAVRVADDPALSNPAKWFYYFFSL